jgi:uncharacterized protein (DUF2236 family)
MRGEGMMHSVGNRWLAPWGRERKALSQNTLFQSSMNAIPAVRCWNATLSPLFPFSIEEISAMQKLFRREIPRIRRARVKLLQM